MQPIPLATQSYSLVSSPAISERLVNLFAEALPDNARSKVLIRSTPGLQLTYQVGTGPIWAMDGSLLGRVYLVSGTDFWRMKPDNESAPEDLGNIGAGVGPGTSTTRPYHPTIAVGVNQVVVCAPPNAWVGDHNDTTFTQISFASSPSAAGASSVCYIDGYFIFTSYDGTLTFSSALLDAATLDGLAYARTDAAGDLVTLCKAHMGQLWYFGGARVSVWYDAAGINFPFAPIEGVVLPYGCANTRTVAQLNEHLFWVTTEGLVVMAEGYGVKRISTFAIEEYLRGNDASVNYDGFAYAQSGHSFYVLTLAGANASFPARTFVYDVSSTLWHERASDASATGIYTGMCAAERDNLPLIGDRTAGILYVPSDTYQGDNGVTLQRLMALPPLQADGNRAFMSRLELQMQMGEAPAGYSTIKLLISDDGGATFRTKTPAGDSGTSGASAGRIYWTRLGSFRQRTMRLLLSSTCHITALYADVVAGNS